MSNAHRETANQLYANYMDETFSREELANMLVAEKFLLNVYNQPSAGESVENKKIMLDLKLMKRGLPTMEKQQQNLKKKILEVRDEMLRLHQTLTELLVEEKAIGFTVNDGRQRAQQMEDMKNERLKCDIGMLILFFVFLLILFFYIVVLVSQLRYFFFPLFFFAVIAEAERKKRRLRSMVHLTSTSTSSASTPSTSSASTPSTPSASLTEILLETDDILQVKDDIPVKVPISKPDVDKLMMMEVNDVVQVKDSVLKPEEMSDEWLEKELNSLGF